MKELMYWSGEGVLGLLLLVLCVVSSASSQQNGTFEIAPFNKTALCPTGWVVASQSTGDYESPHKPICLRLDSALVKWPVAKARCRHGNAFLANMESTIMVDDVRLAQYLQNKGFSKVWTGMHHDHGSLVWDELRPHLVTIYTGVSRGYGEHKQGWVFDVDSFSEGNDTCGALDIDADFGSSSSSSGERQTSSRGPIRRSKRSSPTATYLPSGNSPTPTAAANVQNGGDGENTKMDVFKDFLETQGFKEQDVDRIADPTNVPERKTAKTSDNPSQPNEGTTSSTTTTTDNSQLEDDDYVARPKRSTAHQATTTQPTTSSADPPATTASNDKGQTSQEPPVGFQVSQSGEGVSSSTVTPVVITADRSGQGTSLPASTDPLPTASTPSQSTSLDPLMSQLLHAGLGVPSLLPSGSPNNHNAPLADLGVVSKHSSERKSSESQSKGVDSNEYLKALLEKARVTTEVPAQNEGGGGGLPNHINPRHFSTLFNDNSSMPNENNIDKASSPTPNFDMLSTPPPVTLPTFQTFGAGATRLNDEKSTVASIEVLDQTLNSISGNDASSDKNKKATAADEGVPSLPVSQESSKDAASNGADQGADSSSGSKSGDSSNGTGGKSSSRYVTKSTSSPPGQDMTSTEPSVPDSVDSSEADGNSTSSVDSAEVDTNSTSSTESEELDTNSTSSAVDSAEMDTNNTLSIDSAEVDTNGTSGVNSAEIDSSPISVYNDTSAEIDTVGSIIDLVLGPDIQDSQTPEVSSKEVIHDSHEALNASTPGPVRLNDPENFGTTDADSLLHDLGSLMDSLAPQGMSTGQSDLTTSSTELPPQDSSESASADSDGAKSDVTVSKESSGSGEVAFGNILRGTFGGDMDPRLVSQIALEDCSETQPYVCMSEAIEELSLVGHCDKNWYGHRLLDRCYKPVGYTLTEIEARQRCLTFSGSLASVDTEFYQDVTAMLLRQFTNSRGFGKRAWVDATLNLNVPVDHACSAMEGGHVIKEDCETRLPFICEKQALKHGQHFDDIHNGQDTVTFVRNMTSFHPQTLWCPLRMSSFDDVIVWYKDGRPIVDTDDEESTSFRQNNGHMPNRLDLDLSVLDRSGEAKGRIPKPALLQGQYWCEIWRRAPFHRVISHKIFLKFTDVITLHGTILTRPVDHVTAGMFNRLGQLRGQLEVMERHLATMNKNITHVLRSRLPIVRDVMSILKSTDPFTGRTEFLTYMRLATGDLSAHMRGTLVDLYLDTLGDVLKGNARDIKRAWRVRGPLHKAVTVTMTERCPEAVLLDRTTGFSATFPSTPVNNHAVSMEKCNGVYTGAAWCVGDLATGAAWSRRQISGRCFGDSSESRDKDDESGGHFEDWPPGSEESKGDDDSGDYDDRPKIDRPNSALLELDEIEIEEDNVEVVTDRLAEVLDDTDELTQADIETVAEVVHRIVAVERPPAQVSEKLIRSVDKVLESPQASLQTAERRTGAPSRLISDLEKFGEKARMGRERHVRHVTPNVAMDLWDLQDPQDVVIGVGATHTPSWSAPLVAPRIVEITDKTWAEHNLLTFDVAIQLPEALVRNSIRYSDTSLRLTMFIYRKTSLFQAHDEGSNLDHAEINSAIISASLGGRSIRGLEDKVKIVFKPFRDSVEGESRTRCVFWDDQHPGNAHWSQDGCAYNGTVNGRDVCLCDHLTNFAVLLDFYGDERPISSGHDTSLTILTLIGISLSIFGLAITIITFLAFKKLRQGRAQQTLFNMAVALLCFQTIFLVGVKQTAVPPLCLTVAALLHYFILVSFAWMLIEAVLQYLTFVKVLGTYISRYTLKTVLPAWGLPLIPVITILIFDYNLYLGRQNYCWMELTAFYYAFAMPVGVIVLFNLVMFSVILISLVTRPKGLRSNQSSNKTRETNLKAAFTIFVLLGLTWLFGYLAIEDARLPFQYMFTILSSLQGFFIFVLMVVRRKQVRDHWQFLCCCLADSRSGKQKKLTAQSSNYNSNSNSSNSRTLPSFVNQTYNGDSLVLEPQTLRRQTSVTV